MYCVLLLPRSIRSLHIPRSLPRLPPPRQRPPQPPPTPLLHIQNLPLKRAQSHLHDKRTHPNRAPQQNQHEQQELLEGVERGEVDGVEAGLGHGGDAEEEGVGEGDGAEGGAGAPEDEGEGQVGEDEVEVVDCDEVEGGELAFEHAEGGVEGAEAGGAEDGHGGGDSRWCGR